MSCQTPNVKMIKDPAIANLWLCNGISCNPADGEGSIVINEDVYNVSSDSDGVGAFEFVTRWDHKVLNINIAATSWLSRFGWRIVNCTPTIIDENAIHFGCVSQDRRLATDAGVGFNRRRHYRHPDRDAYRGHGAPADAGSAERRGPHDRGRQLRAGGHLRRPAEQRGCRRSAAGRSCFRVSCPGGEVAICTNSTLTVRILEGDLNLDCKVNVIDDQAIAYRYGASFGNLLYDPWYDLEPALKDRDIDIKDLQKVFGRNGSTCANPIPAQGPLAPPP